MAGVEKVGNEINTFIALNGIIVQRSSCFESNQTEIGQIVANESIQFSGWLIVLLQICKQSSLFVGGSSIAFDNVPVDMLVLPIFASTDLNERQFRLRTFESFLQSIKISNHFKSSTGTLAFQSCPIQVWALLRRNSQFETRSAHELHTVAN